MTDLLSLEDSKENYEAGFKYQFPKDQKQKKMEKLVKDHKKGCKKKNIFEDSKISILESTEMKNKKPEKKLEKPLSSPKSQTELCDKDIECKLVTSKNEEVYAQETPLMFSRSSSLDSLNEFDQHSIHDDQSSIISDFSHRTSGAVSPSDLPDSPTQTVPPSPILKRHNNQLQKTSIR